MDNKTARQRLCCCLRPKIENTEGSIFEALSVSDWNDIVQQSIQQDVTPLLYRCLKMRSSNISIPDEVSQRLREIYLYVAGRNLRLYNELSKVLKVLRSDGTEIIALKGVYLAEAIYDNIVLRPMADIDLLVRRSDSVKLGRKLVQTGYTPSMPFWDEAGNAVFNHKHLPCFTRTGTAKTDRTKIDLHWHIMEPTDPFKIDVTGLWERARPFMLAGTEVLVLSPEDLILHICFHVSCGHQFKGGLKSLCDISMVLLYCRDRIDWEQIGSRAHEWGVCKSVYLVLYLARELLAANVPEEILNVLRTDDVTPELITRSEEAIFAQKSIDRGTSLTFNLRRILHGNRFLKNVSVFRGKVFPSPESLALFYPVSSSSKRIYLYYLVRWKDLFFKFCRVLSGISLRFLRIL